MNTVAIADIVVLIVGKDKYGDKSVCDMLQLIHPLQQPLLVCINKLDTQDEQAVLQAIGSRYAQQLNSPVPTFIRPAPGRA